MPNSLSNSITVTPDKKKETYNVASSIMIRKKLPGFGIKKIHSVLNLPSSRKESRVRFESDNSDSDSNHDGSQEKS